MTTEVTRLLEEWRAGDAEALQRLVPLVYDELKAVARRQLRSAADGTLDTTALVHEAYMKLVGGAGASLQGREHFFAVAASAMRQVLVDHARRRAATKRGGAAAAGGGRDEAAPEPAATDALTRLLAIHEALAQLEGVDPRLVRVVELRVFAGLSVEESARVLQLSTATVKREWRKARALLAVALGGDPPE